LGLDEVMEVIKVLGLVEMYQLVLDSFWHGVIWRSVKSEIIMIQENTQLVEINKNLGCLIIDLHYKLL
jgi:hypothetical protein